jgi:hyperosmotically inducible protein
MKLKVMVLAAVAAASMLAACGGMTSNTNSNTNHSNSMTNLGTNSANSNMYVTNSNVNSSNANKWNSNISKEEYEKNRTEYEKNKGSNESYGQSLEDSWLWFKTKSALATTSDLRDSTINVDVANGVITLKGTVTTAAEKSKAKQVADGIEGKKSVVDQLKVAPNDSMTNTSSGNSNSHSNTNKK